MYTVTVTTGVKDRAGNQLAAQSTWTFTTVADITRPTVISTDPPDNSVTVSRTAAISITFSESMKAVTVTSATNIFIAPTAGGANASGTLSYNDSLKQAIFTPTAGTPLLANTQYTVTVTTGVQDLAGNGLLGNFQFKFTTGP
jgi:methionine-rich copper-binding protein CopC